MFKLQPHFTPRYICDKIIRFIFYKLFRKIPWISPQAFFYLRSKINSYNSILELGSGSSSSWFASQNISILSLESSLQWYEKTSLSIGSNVVLVNSQEQVNNFITNSTSHVLFIDSFNRPESFEVGIQNPNFRLFIIDDAQRYFSISSSRDVVPFPDVFKDFDSVSSFIHSNIVTVRGDSISKTLFLYHA